MTTRTNEAIILAYLKAEADRNPDAPIGPALATADAVIAQLDAMTPGPNVIMTIDAPGGGTDEDPDLALLRSIFEETGEAVGIKGFAEAAETDTADAAARLNALVEAGIATSRRRGRGIYFTPAE
ncbi:MAG TPA: hypothetical protein DIW20_03615 [Rhodospirillaceae bacterium]|nr:hypothetical protein [Rhodospirillaceae bacterium]